MSHPASDHWHQIQTFRHLFFEAGDPARASELLAQFIRKKPKLSLVQQKAMFELAGYIAIEQKRYTEASNFFQQAANSYMAGYAHILAGQYAACIPLWQGLAKTRENHWCATLYGMITRQLRTMPSMIQIRNHLEVDIAYLIRANQYEAVENILFHCDWLTQTNVETPKFMGRSLLHSGWVDRARHFLLWGQKTLPSDPEIYYHLGQYSFQKQQWEDAKVVLNQCLLINPQYIPALSLLEQLPTE